MKVRKNMKKRVLQLAVIFSGILIFQICFTANGWAKQRAKFAQEVSYGLEEPVDEVVGPNGEIYVLDKKLCRVFVYNSNGQLIRNFGKKGTQAGQMLRPEAIALTSGEEIAIADTGNQRVLMFRKTGVYLRELGKIKGGANVLKEPNSIAIASSGNIYVSDKSSMTITMFGVRGELLSQWQLHDKPFDIAVDLNNRLYVLYSEAKKIGQYTLAMKKIKDFKTNMSRIKKKIDIQDLAVDHRGDIYLVERKSHKIVKINQKKKILFMFGSKGEGDGQFDQPEGIVTDINGYLYVADSRNKRVQKIYVAGSEKQTIAFSQKRTSSVAKKLVKTIEEIRSRISREKSAQHLTVTGISRPLAMERSTDDIRLQMSRKLLVKDLKNELAAKWGIGNEELERNFKIVREIVLKNGRVRMTMSVPKEIISNKYTVLTMK